MNAVEQSRGCDVDGCTRPHFGKGLCNTHYYRVRRNGSLELKPRAPQVERVPAPKHVKVICAVEGCDELEDGFSGMCKLHDTRRRRHGDPLVVIHQRDRALPRGEDHPNWAGEDVSYGGAHQRVTLRRGRASEQRCVDCGGQAAQWSYNRECPDEKVATEGPYSADVDQYDPRCVPCHKRFDLDRIAS